ncbi:hypothetical protein CPB97_011023 [Podila verticillata]|nr:hypothetical protein CPB97_011023 [Podila verticillata]
MVYEARRPPQKHIPQETLQLYSHYIRYLNLHKRIPDDVIRSTRLRTLDVHVPSPGHALEIVRSNSQLSSLSVSASQYVDFSKVYPALSALSQLEHLELERFEFATAHQLSAFLNNNPNLSSCIFKNVYGIAGFDGCEPLIRVVRISISCEWKSNPGLVQLPRYCPNLENLTFKGGKNCPIDELTKNLHMHCPKVHSIRHDEDETAYPVQEIVLHDNAITSLIRTPPWLLNIFISRGNLSTQVCKALLEHANWLESVELLILQGSRETIHNMSEILASCPNLRKFALWNGVFTDYGGMRLDWFDDLPWNCPKIESIELKRFAFLDRELEQSAMGARQEWTRRVVTGQPQAFSTKPLAPRHEETDRNFLEDIASTGWTVEPCYPLERWDVMEAVERALRNTIFERTWDYQHIRRIAVDSYVYVNKGRIPRGERS